jgi:hypothetical protein
LVFEVINEVQRITDFERRNGGEGQILHTPGQDLMGAEAYSYIGYGIVTYRDPEK